MTLGRGRGNNDDHQTHLEGGEGVSTEGGYTAACRSFEILVFVLHNAMSALLRWPGKQLKIVDIVLSNWTMIEETTLMRIQMKDKEKAEKDYLLAALEDKCQHKVPYHRKTNSTTESTITR